MATGYEDDRFETKVDPDLYCAICRGVLKDPVQCRENEHHFCTKCIKEHLKYSRNCPTCKDDLTVETLVRPQQFLANTLSRLKISCDNSQRGCLAVVEVGSLNTHEASCDFSPVRCTIDLCDEVISRRDKEIHENKVCDFRPVKCDYCAQMMLHKNFMQHVCVHSCEMKAELTELRSKQDQMLTMMRNTISMFNTLALQRSEGNCVRSVLEAQIVVSGGCSNKFAEAFNMITKTWRRLSEMKECRYAPSSVLYQGRMIVTGGFNAELQTTDSVEELNIVQQDGHWVQSKFILPVPSLGHACVACHDRLFVIGGYTMVESDESAEKRLCGEIHEIQLTNPYGSSLLTRLPKPVFYHGAETVNNKLFIIGGSITELLTPTNDVLMFDPANKTCTELKPLPYAVTRMATVTWKDNVVILGGMNDQYKAIKTVIRYNVTTGSHLMLPEMTTKRCSCIAVILGENIIVMGGCDENDTDLKSVECFNLTTNTWTEFPAMTEARQGATAVVKYC